MADIELGLATRAAWLSYVGGYTQEEIAQRLGVSRVKVNRLIALAQRSGRVRVFVEGTAAECVALETRDRRTASGWTISASCPASTRRRCRSGRSPPPEPSTSTAAWKIRASRWSASATAGRWRQLVEQLPRLPRQRLRFVSLLGSLTRHAAANPFDVIHRLAETTGAECYFMPVPFFADSIEDKRVLIAQKSLRTCSPSPASASSTSSASARWARAPICARPA